jgi:hypothetical protein
MAIGVDAWDCPLILVIGSAGRVKIQPDRLIHAGVSE